MARSNFPTEGVVDGTIWVDEYTNSWVYRILAFSGAGSWHRAETSPPPVASNRITGMITLTEAGTFTVPNGGDYTLFISQSGDIADFTIIFPVASFDGQMVVMKASASGTAVLKLYFNGINGGQNFAIYYPADIYAYQYSAVQGTWVSL